MIYRFLAECPSTKKLRGAGTVLGETLIYAGLHSPTTISNKRVRFFFTQEGYRRFAPFLIAEARRQGVKLRVVKRKRPKEIVYSDDFQVAVLPTNNRRKENN